MTYSLSLSKLRHRPALIRAILCAVVSSAIVVETYSASASEKLVDCGPEEGTVLAHVESDGSLAYRSASWIHCGWRQGVLAISDGSATRIDLDRWDEDEMQLVHSAVPRLRFATLGSVDVLLLTFGYVPASPSDTYWVRLYDLPSQRLLLSAWSSDEPEVIEVAEEKGGAALVIYKDAFSMRPLESGDQPNWPTVISIRKGAVQIEELLQYPEVVELSLRRTGEAIAELEHSCEQLGRVPCIEYYERSLEGLSMQRRTLEILRSAQSAEEKANNE